MYRPTQTGSLKMLMFCFILTATLLKPNLGLTQREEEHQQLEEVFKLADQGKINKAIKECDKLAKRYPEYIYSYINKSILLVKQEKFKEALLALDDGLAANKKSAILYQERGVLYQSYGLLEEAERDFNLGIQFSADNDTLKNAIMISKATVKSDFRNFEAAYEILQECYAFDSTNLATLNNLATVCDEIGKIDLSFKYLHKVIEIDSLFIGSYVNLGFMYQKQEQYAESIPYFDQALAIVPDEPFSLSNRSYSKLMLGDLDGALKDVNRSLELYPGNAYAFRNRALIYIEMGKINKACEDVELALKWNFTQLYGREVLDLQIRHCGK